MKKNLITLLLLIISFSFLSAQIKFQKRYFPGNTFDFPVSVIQTSDKGYLMAGYDIATLGLMYGIDFIKVDSTGSFVFYKTYHSGSWLNPYSHVYELGNINKNSDGTVVMCGSRENNFFVSKLDGSYGVSWIKAYDKGSYDILYYIKQTADGGYIAVGETRPTNSDSSNAFIIKLNSAGNLSWAGMWNYSGINSNDVFFGVEEQQGVGYIAVGYTSKLAGNDTTTDILIVKFDLNGNILWQNSYGSPSHDDQANYIVKSGNNFYICGNTTQDAFLGTDILFMCIDGNGSQVFAKTYSYGLVDFGYKVIPLTYGDFTIIGADMASYNVLLLKVSSTGNLITAYSYSQTFSVPIYVDGQQTHDYGFILLTRSIDNGYYLFKTSNTLTTGCYENQFTTGVNTTTFTVNAITGSYITGVSNVNASMSVDNFSLDTLITDCEFIPCDTPIVTITPASPSVCEGQSITLTASGQNWSGPCTSYQWSTGQTSSSINVSPTSTTTYTVTGYVGSCPSQPVTVQVVVNPVPTAQITGPSAICLGQTATLTASGGINYNWNTGQTSATIQVSPTTTTQYIVTVANQYNCTATATYTLTVNPLPSASITGPDMVCAGNQITLIANGGTSYQWSTQQTTQQINVSPVTNTTYYVTVTNNNNCTATASHSVVVNPVPIISFAGDTSLCEGESTTIIASGGDSYFWSNGSTNNYINVSGPAGNYSYSVTVSYNNTGCSSTGDITIGIHQNPAATATGGTTICQGQSVQLNASGGTTYSWSPAISLSNPNIQNPTATPDQTTTYIVTVTNEWGCTATASTTVNVLESPQFTAVITHVKCYGESNGSIMLQNLTGQPPFSFLWSNGTTTQNVSNLSVGQYSVTVTNAIGCSTVQQFTITQPQPLIANTNISNVSCYGGNNGSISLSVTGGTTPYSYNWSNGQNTATATSLQQGIYSVTITDVNGCSVVLGNLTIAQPATPVSVIVDSIKHVSCFGLSDGYVKVNGNGGTSPYTYHWSNGQNGNYIVNLNANTYYLTITDANNCVKVDSIKITQPLPLLIQATIRKPSCLLADDGKIIVNVSGGTSPYTYVWSNADTSHINDNLTEGTYNLTVTDKNTCQTDTSIRLYAEPVECLLIPTLITPNGDGKNDKFEIKGIQFYSYVKVEIFDRWGDKIFAFEGNGLEYFDKQNQWDGSYQGKKECAPCSFIYIVDVKDNNSPYTGVVTVMK